MLNSSQFARSAVIAATMISVAASPGVARQADMPAGGKQATAARASTIRHWTRRASTRPASGPLAPRRDLTRAGGARHPAGRRLRRGFSGC